MVGNKTSYLFLLEFFYYVRLIGGSRVPTFWGRFKDRIGRDPSNWKTIL